MITILSCSFVIFEHNFLLLLSEKRPHLVTICHRKMVQIKCHIFCRISTAAFSNCLGQVECIPPHSYGWKAQLANSYAFFKKILCFWRRRAFNNNYYGTRLLTKTFIKCQTGTSFDVSSLHDNQVALAAGENVNFYAISEIHRRYINKCSSGALILKVAGLCRICFCLNLFVEILSFFPLHYSSSPVFL